jgi:hypothetical protein
MKRRRHPTRTRSPAASYVRPVVLVWLVARVEADQPLERDAFHRSIAESSGSREGFRRVKLAVLGRAVSATSTRIEDDDVEVYEAPSLVPHDEF